MMDVEIKCLDNEGELKKLKELQSKNNAPEKMDWSGGYILNDKILGNSSITSTSNSFHYLIK